MKIVFFLSSALGHLVWAYWLLRQFPSLRKHRRLVVGIILALSLVSPITPLLNLSGHTRALVLSARAIELMTVLFSAILLGAFLLVTKGFDRLPAFAAADDGAVALRGSREEPSSTPVLDFVAPSMSTSSSTSSLFVSRRQLLEGAGGIAALAGTGSVLGWGMVRGRHAFEVSEVVVKIPGLPRALDGYTLAQISDVHVGTFVGERELGEGFELVRRVRPDLIVATGDLVDHDPAYIPEMAAALGKLSARDGVVAILGNHDYYTDATLTTAALRQNGIRVLVNDALHLRKDDGGGFALLGVDDYMGTRVRRGRSAGPRLDLAMAKAPPDRPKILLAHQPKFFEDSAGQVALQLSGHTHGGQINPGLTPAHLFMEFVAGRYERNGSSLWVNRGFGTAGPPTRVGAPPEVTRIVLVAA